MTLFFPSLCQKRAFLMAKSLVLVSFSSGFFKLNMNQNPAYIPAHALGQVEINSLLDIAVPLVNNENTQRRFDYHHSRRTMLYYLLSIAATRDNENLVQFIKQYRPKLEWSTVEEQLSNLQAAIEPYQRQYKAETLGTYWELKLKANRPGPERSHAYISMYRSEGFQLDELKLYWNYEQIRQLNQSGLFNPTSDQDAHQALVDSPVETRANAGSVQYIRAGIEDAVFQVPAGKQAIVLDFADERMPGGYFLENAHTQEEVILFNSDGYRALLDLKYRLMNGGYMLPEYGLAYIKNVRFFKETTKEERLTDLIVAACYDLSGASEGLYKPPSASNPDDLRSRTKKKFRAIIASAVANTVGNGGETYLLLGPIGTGAFNNNVEMIADLFSEILNEPLMGSTGPIRNAFDQIWFVSIDNLSSFRDVFERRRPPTGN